MPFALKIAFLSGTLRLCASAVEFVSFGTPAPATYSEI
jgi:hypothetical protein